MDDYVDVYALDYLTCTTMWNTGTDDDDDADGGNRFYRSPEQLLIAHQMLSMQLQKVLDEYGGPLHFFDLFCCLWEMKNEWNVPNDIQQHNLKSDAFHIPRNPRGIPS